MPKPANRPTIAVDIDEVLMPHFIDLITWYNKEYGTSLTLEDNHPTEPDNWGTSDINVAIKRVHGFFDTPEFLNSQPYEEAITSLRILSKNYRLVVVTARDTIIEKVTRDWLNKHFKDLISDAHFAARYSLEGKAQTKTAIASTIKAGYLIDDALDHCEDAAKSGMRALLYGDYPWNQTNKLPKGVTRVKNWQEVLEYFKNESAG